MQEPVLNETLCRCCSATPHLLPVSPANFTILSTPSEGLEKNLLCPILLLTSVVPHLLPLDFLPTPPVHPNLGSWCLLGIAGLMVKLNFTAVFKLIESSAWVTGSSGIIMYLIWVFKSAFAVRSGALDLGGSDG